jgi:hypothetical protein
MPDHRAVRYLREALAGVGVLPPYHPGLERITPWLRGVLASDARKAAMCQLAAEIPTSILAALLRLLPTAATRWATLAARTWSEYAAMRLAATAAQ